jgi:Restriction endonuclease
MKISESVDDPDTMNWKQYQEETAALFRALGCEAEVDAKVAGARAVHNIDVWVKFKRFGLEAKWVIECKYWNSPVPKEKVLALRSVIDDVGADKGILISTAGFQSGAVRASEKTNITLTSLGDLNDTVQEDLVSSVIHSLETKSIELQHALRDLYVSEGTGAHSISRPRPGVDGIAVLCGIGCLAMLESEFDRVRLGKPPPYRVIFQDAGDRKVVKVVVDSLEEFVAQASKVISDVDSTLRANLSRAELSLHPVE